MNVFAVVLVRGFGELGTIVLHFFRCAIFNSLIKSRFWQHSVVQVKQKIHKVSADNFSVPRHGCYMDTSESFIQTETEDSQCIIAETTSSVEPKLNEHVKEISLQSMHLGRN